MVDTYVDYIRDADLQKYIRHQWESLAFDS